VTLASKYCVRSASSPLCSVRGKGTFFDENPPLSFAKGTSKMEGKKEDMDSSNPMDLLRPTLKLKQATFRAKARLGLRV
jgi:hypothetical protein